MKRPIYLAILFSIITSSSIHAQAVGGLSYRTFVDGSSSWGGSMEIGHQYESGILAGQFSVISRSPAPGSTEDPARRVSGTQLGITFLYAANVGKFLHLGPEIGAVYGANSSVFNIGGTIKIAFAAIPESALLSIDYGSQTGVGIGLIFPTL